MLFLFVLLSSLLVLFSGRMTADIILVIDRNCLLNVAPILSIYLTERSSFVEVSYEFFYFLLIVDGLKMVLVQALTHID
jgi:hypothetical protein